MTSVATLTKRRMPRKSKKDTVASSSLTRVFIDDLSDLEWVEVAVRLCSMLEVPDLTTRKGLKKLHLEFPEIHGRLSEVLRHGRKTKDVKIIGGVIGIYAKMCSVDAILQDKLIEEGFLKQLMSLLDTPATRLLSFRALVCITRHAGTRCMSDMVKAIPALTRVLREESANTAMASLCVTTLSHSVGMITSKDMVKWVDAPVLSKAVLESLRNPSISEYMVDHAISLLMSPSMTCAGGVKSEDMLPLLSFSVAMLRSIDPLRRLMAFKQLLTLRGKSTPKGHLNAFSIVATMEKQELPSDLNDAMESYGRDHCETSVIRRSSANYMAIHLQYAGHSDLVKLGRALANEMLVSEFALPEILCKCCACPKHCLHEPIEAWEETLSQCASSLRSTADPNDVDFADILEWKYLSVRCKTAAATALAKKAIDRSPDIAYFYYAVGFSANWTDGLRVAKKGLKAKVISPWLRLALLRVASEYALYLALEERMTSSKEERVALLMSSYEDAKVIVEESPPDSMHRQEDLSTYMLIRLVFEGSEVSPNLTEISDVMQKLDINEKFMEFLDRPITNITQINLTRLDVIRLSASAAQEWGDVVDRCDGVLCPLDDRRITLPTQDENEMRLDLTTWIEKFEGESPAVHDRHCGIPSKEKIFNMDNVELFQCSWCSRTSVVLRKCARCEVARYCDADCQKRHWKEHKLVCNIPALIMNSPQIPDVEPCIV